MVVRTRKRRTEVQETTGAKVSKLSSLEVNSAAESGLAFLDLTIRSPLDAKHPSAWNNLGLGVRDVDFIPGVDGLKLGDLNFHCLSPFLDMSGVSYGLLIGHCVWITDGCLVGCWRGTTRVQVQARDVTMFEMVENIGWSLLSEDGDVLVWMVLDQGVGLELGWRCHSNISMTLGPIVAKLGHSGRKI